MPSKRKKKASKYSKNTNKRPRIDSNLPGDDTKFGFEATRGYVDPSTGQRGAFPGLEDDGEEFYGPANDGIDYLRMVRSEAKGIPSLIVANPKLPKTLKQPISAVEPEEDELNYDDETPEEAKVEVRGGGEDEEKDNLGWYNDGTYTASASISQPAETSPPDALEIWHTTLLDKFRKLRSSLQSAFSKVPRNPSPRRDREAWRNRILYIAPTPKELWSLDQKTVLTLIRWNTNWLTIDKGRRWRIGKFWSTWMWSLLLRLDECLTAEEISTVRELGKRCAGVRENLIQLVEEEGGESEDGELEYNKESDDYEDYDDLEGYISEEEDAVKVELEEPIVTMGNTAESTSQDAPAEAPEITAQALDEQNEAIELPTKTPGPGDSAEAPETAVPSKDEQSETIEDLPKKTNSIEPAPEQPSSTSSASSATPVSIADTLGALDMVISIVGDFFGQRDLLVGRPTAEKGFKWV